MGFGPKICIECAGIAAIAVLCSAVLLRRFTDINGTVTLAWACVLVVMISAVLLYLLRRQEDPAGARYDAPQLLACLAAGAVPLTVAPALMTDRGLSDASVDAVAVCCIAFFGAMVLISARMFVHEERTDLRHRRMTSEKEENVIDYSIRDRPQTALNPPGIKTDSLLDTRNHIDRVYRPGPDASRGNRPSSPCSS